MIQNVTLVLTLVLTAYTPQKLSWQEFSPKEGDFKVQFPGTPSEKTNTTATEQGPVQSYLFTVEVQPNAFMIVRTEYPPALLQQGSVEERLERGKKGFVDSVQGKLLKELDITVEKLKGKEVQVKAANGLIITARFYEVGNKTYQLLTGTSEEGASSEDVRKFLDSFKLISPK